MYFKGNEVACYIETIYYIGILIDLRIKGTLGITGL